MLFLLIVSAFFILTTDSLALRSGDEYLFRKYTDEVSGIEMEYSFRSVVILHGMGDSCFNLGLKQVQDVVKGALHDKIPVKCISIGKNLEEDTLNAFKLTMNEQVRRVAELIQTDPELKGPINAIGFSQGNLIIRAYIQKYGWRDDYPSISGFLSIHGPLMGVGALPKCDPEASIIGHLCKLINELTSELAYTEIIQKTLAQSNYYRDPLFISEYLKTSFLPELNMETPPDVDIKGLDSLESLVLIKALDDHTVVPKESEWFGMYEDGTFDKILTFKETNAFKTNAFGLKKLYEDKKLFFETTEGDHMQISAQEVTRLIRKYWL